MTLRAGDNITPTGMWPNQRLATSRVTADSATFTSTETVVMTVVYTEAVNLTYRIRHYGGWNINTAGDRMRVRLRLNSVAGAILQERFVQPAGSGSSRGWPLDMEVTHTGLLNTARTVVVTGVVVSGASFGFLDADLDRPSFLYVDYVEL